LDGSSLAPVAAVAAIAEGTPMRRDGESGSEFRGHMRVPEFRKQIPYLS
jgi:hypothetical protein